MQSQPNAADKLREDDEQRPTLVRELLCAAIHSRAAYGYAMAAGHMSNLLNFALMHTVHQIRYCINVFTHTSVTPEGVLHMNPFPRPLPPPRPPLKPWLQGTCYPVSLQGLRS